ncbi:PDR/VanB family oxidoreductase [Arthrobacter sulfonylureivorans]|uniref:PDR/VanB family oxidoreductase n=1 Tax=Arthrobacter sulfonylureivorans TaxID=2486855 RepID=A0ABY3W710_9MICC|nr:PDR/VanB family oxidoreductase [Arthrobacter sulfonylureivorans]UNK46094.1 PDR/VanB family oxidoreductase [Arthrobacter sulfonylureivorans]
MTDAVLAPVRSRVAVPEATYRVRVAARRIVGEDIVSLDLTRLDGEPFPEWEPGSHVDLFLGEDEDGETLCRQYSLWGAVEDRSVWRIGVLKDPKSRGGSARVHAELLEGTELTVRGPRNHFPLEPAGAYVFFAGGIGITPILPMVHAVEHAGQPWKLYYMARNRPRLALLDEIGRLPADKVVLHCDDESGLIDLGAITSTLGTADHVYACGPGPLLDVLDKMAADAGRWTFHCERFAAAPPAAGVEDKPFEVVLAKSGRTLQVPAGVSCLKVLREAGTDVDWSCTEGVCGTCETEVLEGDPDHRDAVLTQAEREANETMMPCVSRARGPRLVLNL